MVVDGYIYTVGFVANRYQSYTEEDTESENGTHFTYGREKNRKESSRRQWADVFLCLLQRNKTLLRHKASIVLDSKDIV